MPQQHGKSGQANSPRHPSLQIKRCRWCDGRQCIEPGIKPAGKDDRPHAFQHIYQDHHQRRPFPQGSQYVRCPNGFGAVLPDINALEQFPRQIACGRRTEEISDPQSSHTRYPENHGIHLGWRPVTISLPTRVSIFIPPPSPPPARHSSPRTGSRRETCLPASDSRACRRRRSRPLRRRRKAPA
jgi:hypothetical protein